MSCSYPQIKDTESAGSAIVLINDHFKWIDKQTGVIYTQTKKISEAVPILQDIVATTAYLLDTSTGKEKYKSLNDMVSITRSTSCFAVKPVTVFCPIKITDRSTFATTISKWLETTFPAESADCRLNDLYVFALRQYADETNRPNPVLAPYFVSKFNAVNNNERFLMGRFIKTGYPILKWEYWPTMNPFYCPESVIEVCEPEPEGFSYYYKFASCSVPGLAFYSSNDYSHLVGLGVVLDKYPDQRFLVSKVSVADKAITTNLNPIFTTKKGCSDTCYILTNTFTQEKIVATNDEFQFYAGSDTTVQIDGLAGDWTVVASSEDCECGCEYRINRAAPVIIKLTNCCWKYQPCPDVVNGTLRKELFVIDNKRILIPGKAVTLAEYPGVRWYIEKVVYDNQQITEEYTVVDLYEDCNSQEIPKPKDTLLYKLTPSCFNTSKTVLYSKNPLLKPYLGSVVYINLDNRNYYYVSIVPQTSQLIENVTIIDVYQYGYELPEYQAGEKIKQATVLFSVSALPDYSVRGAEYYVRPNINYTNKPVETCKRRYSFWNIAVANVLSSQTFAADAQKSRSWNFNYVENYSKILDEWYVGDSWFNFANDQLDELASIVMGKTASETDTYLKENNLYFEIEVEFKRYRKTLRGSRNQLYGEETDSIAYIGPVTLYPATITNASVGFGDCGEILVMQMCGSTIKYGVDAADGFVYSGQYLIYNGEYYAVTYGLRSDIATIITLTTGNTTIIDSATYNSYCNDVLITPTATPTATPVVPIVPIVPTIPTTIPSITYDTSNTLAALYFTVPYDGGSPITIYQYTLSDPLDPYTIWTDAVETEPPLLIDVGSYGVYTIYVRAVNEVGPGGYTSVEVTTSPSPTPTPTPV